MTDVKARLQGGQGAAIGAQLRRLSDRIDRDVGRIYASEGVVFEQRWFGVLNQIVQNGPMTVGEIAAALRITHVSVSQSVRSLEGAGHLKSEPSTTDRRSRRLDLSDAGRALVMRMFPVWDRLNREAEVLNEEVGDLASALEKLEAALDRRSIFERVCARRGGDQA